MRTELHTFLVECDGEVAPAKRCSSRAMLTAVDEADCDRLLQDRGWKIAPGKQLCAGWHIAPESAEPQPS